MNSWQGMLSGTLCIAALVGAGMLHASDPELVSGFLSFEGARGARGLPSDISVSRVNWSADGRALLCKVRGGQSAEATLVLHDSAQQLGSTLIEAGNHPLTCAALAPDGRHALAVTCRGEVLWIDLSSNTPRPLVLDLSRRALCFTAAAVADDSRLCAMATNTGSILLLDAALDSYRIVTEPQNSGIAELSFSHDRRVLVSVQIDGRVALWDVATRTLLRDFSGHEGPASAAALFSDDNRIISAGLDDTVRIWDIASGREQWRGEFGMLGVKALAVSRDGTTAAWGGYCRKIVVWDLERGRKKTEINASVSAVLHLSFSPNGTAVAVAGNEGMIRLYDAGSGVERQRFDVANAGIPSP